MEQILLRDLQAAICKPSFHLGCEKVVANRVGLVAEVPVYGRLPGDNKRLVAGRADAVCYRAGKPEIVFDWKSDVDPDTAARAAYANQLGQYIHVLGAERGAIVYMTIGQVQWVSAS